MNVAIGNDELGVRDNDSNISHDGHIIRNFLRDREFILLNNTNLANGGPYTRCDPADKSRKSCLGPVIVSKSLFPFIKSLEIDNENKSHKIQTNNFRSLSYHCCTRKSVNRIKS